MCVECCLFCSSLVVSNFWFPLIEHDSCIDPPLAWRMVLPYTSNLHSCVDVRSGGNDLDWDALYGLLRSVHARDFLLAPAVATAGQQTLLSA